MQSAAIGNVTLGTDNLWKIPLQHRNDIQVMRGVAVVLVVIFHLGVPAFSNGFLGVDVFFVISGFLMALLFKPGEISAFYRRRASRLLPAYFATLLAVIGYSSLFVLPSEHAQVVEQGLFGSALASNVGFWMQNSYFSKAEFTPMLHFWSLGVELQFYLLVPLLFWAHHKSKYLLPALFLVSLAATIMIVTISPKTAFFMMPLRIWQFVIGGAVAYYLTDQGAVRFKQPILGLGGMVLLAAVIFIYPIDGAATDALSGHPGWAAFLATAATGLILTFGLPAALADRGLGLGLVRLGDWSYSIYLAHFPIIVFVLYQPFSGTILTPETGQQYMIIGLLIVVSTAVLYRFFDSQRKWRGSFKGIFALITVGIAASLASNTVVLSGYNAAERAVFSADSDRSHYRCGKLIRIMQPGATTCEVTEGLNADAPSLLLVGDSHADSLKMAAAAAAKRQGYRLFITVSNSPLVGAPKSKTLVEIVDHLNVAGVLVHYAQENTGKALDSKFAQSIAGEVPTIWLLPIPRYNESVPQQIWHSLQHNQAAQPTPQNLSDIDAFAADLAATEMRYVDLRPALCSPTCKLVDVTGTPLYFDAHHLTLTGARRTEPLIGDAIASLAQMPAAHGPND